MPAHNDSFTDLIPESERAGLVWPMTPTLQMEAAMVLWEACIDGGVFDDEREKASAATRDAIGTVQLRHDLMGLTGPLHIGWHLFQRRAGDVLSFDWEYTPMFLARCVEWTSQGPRLEADWMQRCRDLATEV